MTPINTMTLLIPEKNKKKTLTRTKTLETLVTGHLRNTTNWLNSLKRKAKKKKTTNFLNSKFNSIKKSPSTMNTN